MTSGLNQTQANKLYLQKTVADTATATETFSGGILTNTINPTTGTGTVGINSGAGNAGGVNILNGAYTIGQTVGTVNILSGTNAAGSIGGNMNLFTTSRGTLTIGSSATNQMLVNTQPQFNQGIISDKMDGLVPTSAMTIGSNLGLGTVEIGNASTFTGGINIGTKGRVPSASIISIGGGSGTTTTLYSGTTYLGYTGSTLNVATPMTPTYNPSAITSGKIGYSVTPTYNTPYSLSPSVVKNIATYSLPVGVYFIQASILTPTVVTYQGLGISSTSATIEYECWSNILTDGYVWLALCVSRMVVITTASTPY